MPFNAYIATRSRKSRRQTDSSGAGAAKTPRVGVNKSDLEAQGEQNGWTARSLTYNEVREMSSSELRWHEQFNAENLANAFTFAENRRVNEERMPTWNVRRMWGGGATPEEDSAARIAGNQFALRCPEFERSIENAQAIVTWMEAHDLDATEVGNYVTAFQALVEEGKLKPAPVQSADDYFLAHPELHDTRTPPLIEARQARAAETQRHFQQAASATAKGTITSLTDYPDEQRGMPPYSDIEKASLRAKVKNMSSSELAEKCQNDPSFKKSLDSL